MAPSEYCLMFTCHVLSMRRVAESSWHGQPNQSERLPCCLLETAPSFVDHMEHETVASLQCLERSAVQAQETSPRLQWRRGSMCQLLR